MIDYEHYFLGILLLRDYSSLTGLPLLELYGTIPFSAVNKSRALRHKLIEQIETDYRVLLRSLAQTSVAAGGLGKECTLGQKLHLVLRKGGSPTGFRLLRTLFLSQLCQLLTTRPHMKSTDVAGQTELGWEATEGAGGTRSGVVSGANHQDL